jgi:hypothetical protein
MSPEPPISPEPPMSRAARGWPFLIGAGRRHEYRTLIAPDFLVAASEYGILDRHAGRTADGETRIVRIRSGSHPLWIAYATRTITVADLPDPRDEHGRPLQVLAGFVCEAPIERPDPADLAIALDTGMSVYRRYLDDEDRFGVRSAEPFALRSALRPPAAPPRRPVPGPAPRPGRWTAAIVGGAALVLAALITVFAVTMSAGDRLPSDRNPTCGPTTSAAITGPTPTCG